MRMGEIWTHSTFPNLVKLRFHSKNHIWHCRTRLLSHLVVFLHSFSQSSVVERLIDDDDGYWFIHLYRGWLPPGWARVRSQGWTCRDYGDGWMLCVCLSVCVWIESSESVLILYFFNVDMCSTVLNGDTLLFVCLFVWHLNKVCPTLTLIAVQFMCVLIFQTKHTVCPLNK